jgi:hypothetical protein
MREDDDSGAPAIDDLKFRAGLLRAANPKPRRHRGEKGKALRELAEIEERLQKSGLSPQELIEIEVRLDGLSGGFAVREKSPIVCCQFGGSPLGPGPFDWRRDGRPQGATSTRSTANLDFEILIKAIEIAPSKSFPRCRATPACARIHGERKVVADVLCRKPYSALAALGEKVLATDFCLWTLPVIHEY